ALLGGGEWAVPVTHNRGAKVEATPARNEIGSRDGQPKADLRALHAAIRSLVLKHYPKADVTLESERIHFSFNTRKFMIHEPLLTGEWQDAWEDTGPQKGGILGCVELRPGSYGGQASRPQAHDKRYFTDLYLAPHSAARDCYLDVMLRYPHDAPEDFLADFRRLVDGFETYLPPPGK